MSSLEVKQQEYLLKKWAGCVKVLFECNNTKLPIDSLRLVTVIKGSNQILP